MRMPRWYSQKVEGNQGEKNQTVASLNPLARYLVIGL